MRAYWLSIYWHIVSYISYWLQQLIVSVPGPYNYKIRHSLTFGLNVLKHEFNLQFPHIL